MIQLQTSFVPKKSYLPTTAPEARFGRTINVFAVVSIVVFLAVALLAAVTFFYRGALISEITAMDTDLVKAEKNFEPEFVDTAVRLHKRIESVKTLLGNHRSISPLFDILEKKTLEQVRFQGMALNSSEAEITLSMTGEAKSFNSVALQSDVFGGEQYFQNPVFSNFTLSEKGDVIFNFKTNVDPSILRYQENILRASASATSGTDTTAQSTTEP
ncbi:MAG: hypothetical protein COV91_05230 [Candidatus Taylorbacteria bacterium CG11_big_fil_rev_8_21_14_0_20_46_11]|uniref:PilN domain-containing protein n=1 Tax=Candidatus Taylorbacteria bacterium CG11_big_fil_rev_8_21_14_0_20_46_11 TaxID=1975025 RepID=A0A2H0KAE4_9BACT|nr:MAG: hypothetical protein COV91_05230 [Candidatus Taylorbacteria bacterium CG11_big_fil_rev_8_21_14_0_20_46_11]